MSAKRSGAIQFRNPATLDVLSTINISLPPNSTGIDGVWADPDGQTLYIEGPEHTQPNGPSGCCWLYSIDLQSLQVKLAAGIWGSQSRRRFLHAGSSLLTTVPDVALVATQVKGDQWQISPDGHWWAGLRSGPAVDFYDASRNKIVRSFQAEQGNTEWYLNAAWLKDQFYIYTTHDGSGWLWQLSPGSNQLGEPIVVPGPASVEGCAMGVPPVTEMTTVGNRLVVNEEFGGKIDRRQRCDAVSGGAWIIDPASLQSVVTVAPDFHFWRLVPNQDGTSLYGVTSDAPVVGSPSQLLHLDARSGAIVKSQSLEGDYWWIIAAKLHSIPVGNTLLTLPVNDPQ